jgi:hypothetical protein
VVVSRQSSWEPSVYRLIIPAGQDPGWRIGPLVDLFNSKRDDWLGKYEVLGHHPGRMIPQAALETRHNFRADRWRPRLAAIAGGSRHAAVGRRPAGAMASRAIGPEAVAGH